MLLPRPTMYQAEEGEFALTEATVVRTGDSSLAGTARWLQSALRPPTGLALLTEESGAAAAHTATEGGGAAGIGDLARATVRTRGGGL